jgi:hypothetical protein
MVIQGIKNASVVEMKSTKNAMNDLFEILVNIYNNAVSAAQKAAPLDCGVMQKGIMNEVHSMP